MKIYYLLLLILPCLNETNKFPIPDNSTIKTKYTLMHWDTASNSNYTFCDHELRHYEEMETYDCAFLLAGNQVHLREKFILDKNGNLVEYWSYKPMGPLTYSIEDLRNDLDFLKHIGGENLKIQLNKETIIDSGQEYKIKKVYESHKLILVELPEDHGKAGKRILYEYE